MLVATFPLPPTTNHLYANAGPGQKRVLTREGKEYKTDVMKRLMLIGARSKCPDPPYVFRLWILVADRKRRDASNMAKAIEDALSAYLCYDDSKHYVLTVYKAMDKENPRAVIQLQHKDRSIPSPPDLYRPQGDTGVVLHPISPSTELIDEMELA